MAISLVGVGTFVAATTSPQTFTLPGGVTTDDLIIVHIGAGEDSPEPTITSSPGGYEIRGTKLFLDYGPGALNQWIYWKIAGSSESNPSFSTSEPAGGFYGYTAVFRGVDTTSPFDLASVSQGTDASASTFTPPSVDTQTANAWVVSFAQSSDDNQIALLSGSEQGFTLTSASGASYSTSVGTDAAFGMAYKLIASPTTVTLPTWQQNAVAPDYWAYQTLGLTISGGAPAPAEGFPYTGGGYYP